MINLLGTHDGVAVLKGDEPINRTPGAHLHIYGKLESRIGRKMGHLTVLGMDTAETHEIARKLGDGVEI